MSECQRCRAPIAQKEPKGHLPEYPDGVVCWPCFLELRPEPTTDRSDAR